MATEFGPTALVTPANAVTVARVLAMPILLGMILADGATWATVTFWFIVSCTDGVDGWLARRQGATRSGAFLDPLADKIVVLTAMGAMVAIDVFSWVPVLIIAARELGLVAFRTRISRRGISLPARRTAKLKTVVQDLSVGAALLPSTADHPSVAHTLLWLAVGLTLFTGGQYLFDARRAASAM